MAFVTVLKNYSRKIRRRFVDATFDMSDGGERTRDCRFLNFGETSLKETVRNENHPKIDSASRNLDRG